MVELYMPILNEHGDAWRPVEVTPLEGAVYRVEGPMPADEQWAFPPGTLVAVSWKVSADGEQRLIPTGLAPTIRSEMANHYKRMAGLALGVLLFFSAMEILPRAPHGEPEPVPLLIVTAAMVLMSVVGLIWLRPRALIFQWGLWSALGFASLFCLISLSKMV